MRGLIWDIVILSIGESLPLIVVILCRSGSGLWDGCCGLLWDGRCRLVAVGRSLWDGRAEPHPRRVSDLIVLLFCCCCGQGSRVALNCSQLMTAEGPEPPRSQLMTARRDLNPEDPS